MAPLRTLATLATLTVAVGLLAGCGTQDSEPPLSETLPSCDDVWVAGRTLPEDYAGCRDDEGTLQVSKVQECTTSDERLTQFGTDFYAMLGAEVHDDGLESVGYQEVYQACFGKSW